MGHAEPRFDIDLKYGQQGELQIREYCEWIAAGNGRVEVKRKRYVDLEFYIEQECDKGRTGHYEPSGISVTTAEAWALVIDETNITVIVPTDLLRAAVDHKSARRTETLHGSCPTRGRLVNLGAILDAYRRQVETFDF